jgi:colanic acid biosynthesis glycosyl transferase WcaI
MNILVLGINYLPEKTGIAPFTAGLCEHLAGEGHRVTVVTAFPYYPGWKVLADYRGLHYRAERLHGVRVHRVWHFVPRQPSRLWQRLAHDLSFTLSAFLVGLFTGKCDLVYCSCPPPTLGLAAYVLSRIHRVPYVVKLADLATDAALCTGILREGYALRLGRRLEQFVYTKAWAVACLCQGFIECLAGRGIPREKLPLIPDWGDTEKIRPIAKSSRFRAEQAIPAHHFVIVHTGNMGKKQALANAIRAAETLQGRPDIHWILIGDGEERPALEREASVRAPRAIRFLPLQPAELLPHIYAEADLLLLNQKATVKDAVIPSKLLTYMAAGRPIVAAVDPGSEAARHIRAAGCGLLIAPEDPQALADAVLRIMDDPHSRAQMGANGRRYAETHFTKQAVLQQYHRLFDGIGRESLAQLEAPDHPPATQSSRKRAAVVDAAAIASPSCYWQSPIHTTLKRILDVVLSLILLLLLLPLFVILAIAVKFSSPGPIFYRWKVVGQGGRYFVSYKFRSMVANADELKASLASRNEMHGPMFKLTDDPRVTRLGRRLRKYSLDELPQLWSVLVGDMSLVGPRPPLQTEYVHFSDYQKQKLRVKPGLTCLWQVSGRNDVRDLDDWVRLDLMYVAQWSLALDFKIALRTLPVLLLGKGK